MATENIKKRAKAEQESLTEGIKASIEEMEGGRLTVTYNGKEFDFPKEQPAWVLPFLEIYGEGKDKELSEVNTVKFITKLIGKDLAMEIAETADNDFSTADLGEQIVTPIQEHWAKVDKKK